MAPNISITDNKASSPTHMSKDYELQSKESSNFITVEQQRQLSIRIPHPSEYNRNPDRGSQLAILRSLRGAGVKFIRFATLDLYNTIRSKAVPISQLLSGHEQKLTSSSSPLSNPVSIAEICFAGLPNTADVPSAPNLTAKNVLTLQPDLASLRILPYANKTAMSCALLTIKTLRS